MADRVKNKFMKRTVYDLWNRTFANVQTSGSWSSQYYIANLCKSLLFKAKCQRNVIVRMHACVLLLERSFWRCTLEELCRGRLKEIKFTRDVGKNGWALASYDDGTWPSCCSRSEFDMKKVSSSLPTIEKYWPTLSYSSTSR